MKKAMMMVFTGLFSLVLLVFIAGLMLPRQRTFVKKASFKAAPERVYRLVSEVDQQAVWRSDVQEIRVIDAQTWTEVPKKGTPITFRVKQSIENRLLEIEIVEPKSFSGYWEGIFEETKTGGTAVVFKEVVVISNPFLRVMARLFVDLNSTMDEYMHNLKAQLGG
jgi:hypothetical protein